LSVVPVWNKSPLLKNVDSNVKGRKTVYQGDGPLREPSP